MSLTEIIHRELDAAMQRYITDALTPQSIDEQLARIAADLEARTGTPWDVTIGPDPWTINARPQIVAESVVLCLSIAEHPDAAE